MSNHHINADGTQILCTAPPEARCRTAPDCDTEFWYFDGCGDHEPKHPLRQGGRCWMAEGVNNASLADAHGEWAGPAKIVPGAAVFMVDAADAGTYWDYEGSDE